MKLAHIFSENGILASAISGFRVRHQQLEIAEAISDAIETHSTLVAEAGTGTGKTFAYLAPVLLSGQKAVISTATKTLQEQLFNRDLPAMCRALKMSCQCAMLKGRDNYLCLYRLNKATTDSLFREERDALENIRAWSETTLTGDKSELSEISDQAPIWQIVTSTRDNCLGSDCPDCSECFVMSARRNAQCADIVVINHHLFLADLILKDEGVGELLPKVDIRIFDEAHQLPEIASLFFGSTISTNQCGMLLADIAAELKERPADLKTILPVFRSIEESIRSLRKKLPFAASRFSKAQIETRYLPFLHVLSQLHSGFEKLYECLSPLDDGSAEFSQFISRITMILGQLTSWLHVDDAEENNLSITWVESTRRHVKLNQTPVNVGETMRAFREQLGGTWVFLSATLAIEKSFDHFIQEMGLQDPMTGCWESPFEYERQALLVLPANLPNPNTPLYTRAVVESALPLVLPAPGGTFFLFTSLSALNSAETIIAEWLAEQGLTESIPLLVQGKQSRTELLERFRREKKAILLGSHSFWEGIDMPGDLLSLVVIDKLPFQPPDDPVLNAKAQLLAAQGKNSFMALQLPKAVISLKQGAGRLIRSETDRGILLLGDPRLLTKSYGGKILRSLPFVNKTKNVEDGIRLFESFNSDNSPEYEESE